MYWTDLLVAVWNSLKFWYIIRYDELAVRSLFGHMVKKIYRHGTYLVVPLFDEFTVFDKYSIPLVLPIQPLQTKDKQNLVIQGCLHYQVIDPLKLETTLVDVDLSLKCKACGFLAEFVGKTSSKALTPDDLVAIVIDDLESEFNKAGLEIIDFDVMSFSYPLVHYPIEAEDMRE